ncbi:hypothetical protein [Bizionia myxarmorum]|uniref:Uncharacterized protein n=1 Tax=Bizionia myxarmorum TaxID=291186 RepID=A0A5D0QY02_9FLAO|nr:hypothetical protein [Bizionia myxarmorum]TYB74060.1 hypothetical protein ES674_15020 [Bizionia myxarmorum]
MSKLNYKEYYPINDSAALKETTYSNLNDAEIKRWNNFKIITRSKTLSNSLLENQSNICPICSKYLNNENKVIHHIDYERLCDFEDNYSQVVPTLKNPDRKLKVPKCDICPNRELCLSKVVLIHSRCHFILHKMEGRIKNDEKKRIDKNRLFVNEPSKYWLNKTTFENLELVDAIFNLINTVSTKQQFKIRYNQNHISIKPSSFIYFKPDDDNLKISLSLGDLSEWKKELENKRIPNKLSKKQKPRLSFTIDFNDFKEHNELFIKILNDAINDFDSSQNTENHQLTLF